MATNPLLRTPARELRRHALLVGSGVLTLAVAVPLAATAVSGTPDPGPQAMPTVTDTLPVPDPVPATGTPTGTTTAVRTVTRQCPAECTLTFTATGGVDVRLAVSHVGVLTDSHPLAPDGTASRIQVTGTGTFQATATATDWVDLSVEPAG